MITIKKSRVAKAEPEGQGTQRVVTNKRIQDLLFQAVFQEAIWRLLQDQMAVIARLYARSWHNLENLKGLQARVRK